MPGSTGLAVMVVLVLASVHAQNLGETLNDYLDGSEGLPNTLSGTAEDAAIAVYCHIGAFNETKVNQTLEARYEQLFKEMNYTCGDDANAQPNTLKQQADANFPDTSQGTAPAVRALCGKFLPYQVYSLLGNIRSDVVYLELTQRAADLGYLLDGAQVSKAKYVEAFVNSTGKLEKLIDSITGQPYTLAKGSDTSAVVAQLAAPASPKTAVFTFHGTDFSNECNVATDLNLVQAKYSTPDGLLPCVGCMVHQGFLGAFQSLTNATTPSQNLVEEWENLSGVAAKNVEEVLCIGHSLGAALATLCGPWARSSFPNAKVFVYASASPRVGNALFALWYDTVIGSDSIQRVINNRDLIPSLPTQVSPGIPRPVSFYEHVGGVPLWLYREGPKIPGNYTAYSQFRPLAYTGNLVDHGTGYILALKQVYECNF